MKSGGYDQSFQSIVNQSLHCSFQIVGITGVYNIYKSIDGYKFIPIGEIKETDFDYIVVAAANATMKPVFNMLQNIGIPKDKLIRADVFLLPYFNFTDYIKLREKPVSIISRNCFGGILYNRLNLKFSSPTINLFFENDFIKFSSHLYEYLNKDLKFCTTRWEENLKFEYPVMTLGDIKINFNHYKTVKEASTKWHERIARINKDNIFVITYAYDVSELDGFEDIPYRKLCFTSFPTDAEDTLYLPHSSNKNMWVYVNAVASGEIPIIDPIKLLFGKKDYIRCEFKNL